MPGLLGVQIRQQQMPHLFLALKSLDDDEAMFVLLCIEKH